jgi:transposase-like protein
MPPKRRASYTAEFKIKVIKYAEENGNRMAARDHQIDEKNVRRWRQEKNVLEVINPKKRARRGRRAFWPEIESDLKEWILKKRNDNRKVSTIDIRLKARLMAGEKGIIGFKGEPNWCHKFMKRNRLSVRAITSVGQPLPSDWEEKAEVFRNYVSQLKSDVELAQFGNMDEVAVSFDIPDSRTVDETGKEDIILTTTGAEKCNFTVVLCCTADGGKCDPMVIFKRKTMPKEQFPKGIVVTVSPKGWMTQEVMTEWLDRVWRKRKGAFFSRKSLLIYDSHRSHLTPEVKKIVEKYSQLAVIPGGLTKKLQPLDLSANKSFKSKMRNKWEKWMVEGIHTFTKSGKMRRASYVDVCNWIVDSWKEVTPECIKNGFRRGKLHDYDSHSSSLSNEFDIDNDSSDSSDEELDPNLAEYGDILEAFHIESDEEFDGFE